MKCHCGKDLHYTQKNIEETMQKMVRDLGEFITVTNSKGKHYRVQRHYIALHGIQEPELPTLGFEEVFE
jgi:hypothetical protein